MAKRTSSLASRVINTCVVFTIGPFIAGVAGLPIAKAAGLDLKGRFLVVQIGILLGAVAALLYFSISSRHFSKWGADFRITYLLVTAVLVGVVMAFLIQLFGYD